MNKLLLLLILPVFLFAQKKEDTSKLRFGLLLQPEFTNIQLGASTTSISSQSKWGSGLSIGGLIQLRLANRLYLRTEVTLGERKYRFQETTSTSITSIKDHEITLDAFDISFGLSYDVLQYNNFSLGLNAGMSYSIFENMLQRTQIFVSNSPTVLEVQEYNGAAPENNYSLATYIALTAAYQLGKNTQLFLEPRFSFGIRDLQLDGLEGHRLQNLSAAIGIRFQLGMK